MIILIGGFMEEYLAIFDKLRNQFHNDSLYLNIHFDTELIPKLQKVVDSYYDEKFNHHVRIIEKYSSFDMRVLGPILASIVSIFEGHQFVYQDITLPGKKDNNDYYNNTNYLMIFDSYLRQANYFVEDIASLTANNEAFIIKKKYFSSRIKETSKSTFEYEEKFYDAINYYIKGEGDVRPLLKNEQFPYLKEFMDYVIDYKIINKIENIKEETLLALRKDFIRSHLKEINQKVKEYDQLKKADIQNQIAELTQKLNGRFAKDKQERKLLLKKVLDK